MYVNVIYLRKLTPKSKELEGWGVGERGRGWRGVLDGKRGGGGFLSREGRRKRS